MIFETDATPATDATVKTATKTRTPHRPDATDKAAREILAAERKAQLAKTERLRAARLAAAAAEPVVKAAVKAAEPRRRGTRKAAN